MLSSRAADFQGAHDCAVSDTPLSSPQLPSQPSNQMSVERELKATKDLSYLIISGGTGANSIAGAFGQSPAFVLPVSDDGGSSAEILRCFGGPAIGDIRSRLTRLIPVVHDPGTNEDKERGAIYNLMAYRFPEDEPEKVVRDMWLEIVEGKSQLWDGIGEDKKECIRAFLVHFETQCLKRAHKRFSFRNFSLGNGFLTGARDLFGSLPSAIFLFKSIAGVSSGVQVIPVINTNQTVTIAAELANGSTLVGQCSISHPSPSVSPTGTSNTPVHGTAQSSMPALHPMLRSHFRRDSRTFDTPDASAPPSRHESVERLPLHREDGKSEDNIGYRKGEDETPLEARIDRIFYINLYGQEIYPDPNPEFINSLHHRDILVYSCGSLWTSIIPCLALKNLAAHIAASPSLLAKVLLLNSSNDRETPDYVASEYVATLLRMLKNYDKPRRKRGGSRGDILHSGSQWGAESLISHVVWLEGCNVDVDEERIADWGIKLVKVPYNIHRVKSEETPMFSNEAVEWAMERVMEDVTVR